MYRRPVNICVIGELAELLVVSVKGLKFDLSSRSGIDRDCFGAGFDVSDTRVDGWHGDVKTCFR